MPLRTSILIGVALLLAAAFLDWVTGPEVASAIFYLVPIIWMSWRAGRWPSLITALVSGGIWLAQVLISHKPYSNHWIPFWNGFARTTSFCLVAGLLSEVMERRRLEGRVRQARDCAWSPGSIPFGEQLHPGKHVSDFAWGSDKVPSSISHRLRVGSGRQDAGRGGFDELGFTQVNRLHLFSRHKVGSAPGQPSQG
jgi:hypothetical protein